MQTILIRDLQIKTSYSIFSILDDESPVKAVERWQKNSTGYLLRGKRKQ